MYTGTYIVLGFCLICIILYTFLSFNLFCTSAISDINPHKPTVLTFLSPRCTLNSGSMSRRRRRTENVDSDVEEMERPRRRNKSVEEDEENGVTDEDGVELVRRCVEYLLHRNSKRRPVRRQELTKFVMLNYPSQTGRIRAFTNAFEAAMAELENEWLMRVVEVFKKSRPTTTQSQSRRSQSQTASQGSNYSKAYVLVSTQKRRLRPHNKREWANIGFITVVTALIALTPECRISEEELYRSLKRIGAEVKVSNGHKEINNGNVKDYIETILTTQWYLDREKDTDGFYYKIGPRVWVELDIKPLLEFIESIYNQNDEGNSGLDENSKKDLRRKLEAQRKIALGEDESDEN